MLNKSMFLEAKLLFKSGNIWNKNKEYFKGYTWCYTELKILIITNGKDDLYARKSRYRV